MSTIAPARTETKSKTTASNAGQTTPAPRRPRRQGARHFIRHLVEMILAMMIGMAALGALWRAVLAVCDVDASDFRVRHAAVVALVMAFDMTVPMVWWMRHRGHSWARGGEMAGAMIVPTFVLIGLLQLDAVSGESLIGLEHALMLPAMLLVMLWRLDEYTRPPGPVLRHRRSWLARRVSAK